MEKDRDERLGIILQARMGSKRLPGKILKKIGDKSLLDHIFFRLKYLKHRAVIVLATSLLATDNIVERYCIEHKICCFRGSEENVLERYYICAKNNRFFDVVRLTGDNPFLDIEELDNLIDFHYANSFDYSSSQQSLPEGLGAEIFSFSALEKSFLNTKEPRHLEHVNEYILDNLNNFRVGFLKVQPEKNGLGVRLTVDTDEDYKLACFIAEKTVGKLVSTREAILLASQFK